MAEQLGYLYFECPECEWSAVTKADFPRNANCPLCASDSGHVVLMRSRVCREDDKAEGYDARKENTQ